MALYTSPGDYKRPLKKYLNDFTGRHRMLDSLNADLLRDRFDTAARLLNESVGRAALRTRGGAVNAAFTEALLVGLTRRLDAADQPEPSHVAQAVQQIVADPALDIAISRATVFELGSPSQPERSLSSDGERTVAAVGSDQPARQSDRPDTSG